MTLELARTADAANVGATRIVTIRSRAQRIGSLFTGVATAAVLGAVLTLPLAYFPEAQSAFSVPKGALLQSLAAVALAALIIGALATKSIRIRASALDRPLLVYLAIALIGVLRASSKDAALFGTGGRSDGFVTALCAIVLYFVAYQLPTGKALLRRALELLCVAGALLSLEGVAETLGHSFVGFIPNLWSWRAYGTSGNPDFLGSMLTLMWPLPAALMVGGSRRVRPFWAVSLGLMLAALVVSYTRGSWIGSVPGLIVLLVLGRRELRPIWRWLLVTVLLSAVLVAVVESGIFRPSLPDPAAAASPAPVAAQEPDRVRPSTLLDRIQTATDGSGRLLHWGAALQVVRDEPLLGTGYGNLFTSIMRYEPKEWYQISPGTWVDKAHNLYLDRAASLGIPGFVAFLWLMGTFVFVTGRFILRRADGLNRILLVSALAAWVGYMANLFFLFETVDTMGVSWVLMGLTLREISGGQPSHHVTLSIPAAPRVLAGFAAAALTIFGIYWFAQPVVAEYYLWKGEVAANHNNLDAAVGAYFRAAELNPYSEPVQTQVAFTLDTMAQMEKDPRSATHLADNTVRILNRLIQRDPDYAFLYGLRADTYTHYPNGEHLRDALTDFRHAVELYPNYYFAIGGVADCAHQLGLTNEAVAAGRKLLELDPNDQQVLRVLAQDYVRMHRWQDAINNWERMIRLGGDSADLRVNIAQALLMSGQKDRGMDELQKAQALDPENGQVKQTLQSLQTTGGNKQ